VPVIYNRLPKIAASARPMVERAVEKTAYDTEALAKVGAPVDTGNLRNSIAASSAMRPLTWRVYANADYALYVEVGTRKMPGHFYLTNALSQSWTALTAAIGKDIGL
jgi:HK97 gp10 family phage protein